MRLLILIGVAVFTSELSNVHAGQVENKSQDFTSVYHPPVYTVGNPGIPPNQQGVPEFEGTNSSSSYPNGPQGSQSNHGSPNGNYGPRNRGPVSAGDHTDHPQINLSYDPVNSHYDSQKEECYTYDKSCEVEFHGYPPKECGRHPWNIAKCEYFVLIRRDYKKQTAKFTLSTVINLDKLRNGNKQGYVAVGISKDDDDDDELGDDDVVECVLRPDGKGVAYHSYIGLKYTAPVRQKDDVIVVKVLDIQQIPLPNQKVNLTCIFERHLVQNVYYHINDPVHDFNATVDLNRGKFHVLLARGQLKGPHYYDLGKHDSPTQNDGWYVSEPRYAKFWKSGCHKKRPSNMLIASIILLIVSTPPSLRK